MIDTKTNRSNLFLELDKLDIVNKIKPLLDRHGYMQRMEDGKFVPKNVSLGYDAPWIYVESMHDARCDLYHRVFYNILDHIHSYCRSCWKVVVRPKTLVQLFDLYEFQKTMGVPCKCGIEKRDNVHGLYGGYFYTRSKEEGLERYKQVRDLVDRYLGKDVQVLLKRYCTEFEIGGQGGIKGKGDSSKVGDLSPEEIQMEQYLEAHFPPVGYNNKQPKHGMAAIMKSWIMYAYKHGDETYKVFTNGEPLFPGYTTYHKEE